MFVCMVLQSYQCNSTFLKWLGEICQTKSYLKTTGAKRTKFPLIQMFQERECYTSKSLGGESKNLHCKREFIIRDDVRLLVAVTDVRQTTLWLFSCLAIINESFMFQTRCSSILSHPTLGVEGLLFIQWLPSGYFRYFSLG